MLTYMYRFLVDMQRRNHERLKQGGASEFATQLEEPRWEGGGGVSRSGTSPLGEVSKDKGEVVELRSAPPVASGLIH
jgi:hypothetical protein